MRGKILLTGATGALGPEIISQLLTAHQNSEIILTFRTETKSLEEQVGKLHQILETEFKVASDIYESNLNLEKKFLR
jgi:FlaA1/EpsC-like NDP-sugar epimerase